MNVIPVVDPSAVSAFVEAFSDSYLAHDVGTTFTCDEIDALAGILAMLGAPDAAAAWLTAHSADDEEGDAHYTPPTT